MKTGYFPDWFVHRDPKCLPEYDAFYESEEYDEVMRNYGDVIYSRLSGEAQDSACSEVATVMEQVRQEKHQQFVLRHSC